MHAFDHCTELRRHQSRRLCAGDAERVHGFVRVQIEATRRPCRRGKDTERRPGMPALLQMLWPHTDADARPDFIPCGCGRQKIFSAQPFSEFSHCDQRGQHHRTDMQHALAMHVVKLESLHLRAIHERGVRRRQFLIRAPNAAHARGVKFAETLLQDPAPFELRAIECAAQRVQHQKLEALPHFSRDVVVAQVGHELRHASGVLVVLLLFHRMSC